MISSFNRFVGICLLVSPLAGLASTQIAYEDKHPIEAQLKASVHEGMTIDEAVAQSITAAPGNGRKITETALSMYRGLSKTACAIRAKDGGMRFEVWPDFKACGDRIVHAAIEAGADPTDIIPAPAAGLPEGSLANHGPKQSSDNSARNTFGVNLYVLRQIFLGE